MGFGANAPLTPPVPAHLPPSLIQHPLQPTLWSMYEKLPTSLLSCSSMWPDKRGLTVISMKFLSFLFALIKKIIFQLLCKLKQFVRAQALLRANLWKQKKCSLICDAPLATWSKTKKEKYPKLPSKSLILFSNFFALVTERKVSALKIYFAASAIFLFVQE